MTITNLAPLGTQPAPRPAPSSKLRACVASPNLGRTYTARQALDPQTRQDAYAVRHSSYLNSGYIEARPDALFSDRFDSLPSSYTSVIYENEKPVASVRLCFFSRSFIQASPAGVTFPEEVSQLLAPLPERRGRPQAAEITRLVRSPSAGNNQGLVFLLLRLAGFMILREDVPRVIMCVRQNHTPFYRRLGCNVMSDPKPYPGLSCQMQLLEYPRDKYDEARAAFPIMDPMAGPPDSFDGFMAGRPVTMPLAQERKVR